MSRAKLSALIFPFLIAACGGGDKQPPKSPETEPVASSSPDMPAGSGSSDATTPPASDGDKDKAASPGVPDPGKPAITLAAMKFTPAKGKKGVIEVKADGSISADGKPAGKITADHVEDATGKTLASVGSDGAITGDGIKSGLKFSGDDVVTDDGNKLVTVGDDGTVSVAKGAKTEAAGKFDNGGTAKRAAALIAVVWMSPKDAGAPAAKASGGKGGGDAAAKPAGGKPPKKK